MSTLSEKIGVHKEVVGQERRTKQETVEVLWDVREYVGDKAKLDALPTPSRVVPSNVIDGEHPSPFDVDPLVRTVLTPMIVRRSLTWREAVKAVFSRNRPLVAIEVQPVFEDGNFNLGLEDSFV